jgi:F0F1-type ATP synthase assembly protein I
VGYNNAVEKNKHNDFTKRMMFLALEIGLIFAIPAVLVGFFGPRLDLAYGTEDKWTIILLIIGLVTSWSIVIWKYKKAVRELKAKKQNGLTQD